MNIQLKKRTLAVAMAVGIGLSGIGAAPAMADSNLAAILNQMIQDTQNNRKKWEQRKYRKYKKYRRNRSFDDFRVEDREYPVPLTGQYTRGLSGLYRHDYDANGVLRNNYSGHRH